MSIIFRRFLALFLSLMIVISSTQSAFANTSIGGWSALDVITAGATNTINATKTAGGKVLTSAVTVAPSAAKVGKHLIKGGGAAALAYAMVELLDAGIDWVLDPANNAVRYVDPNAASSGIGGGYTWRSDTYSDCPAGALSSVISCVKSKYDAIRGGGVKYTDVDTVDYILSKSPKTGSLFYGYKAGQSNQYFRFTAYGTSSDYPSSGDSDYKYIPIETVAAKVISNVEAGHAPSQEAVKATALEGFAAGEHDVALEAAATEVGSDAGTDNPTDPNNPTDPQDPAVPFDPSSIIAAINALKALLAGILSSITSLTDFFKSDPPPEPKPEDTELDIPLPDLPTPDTDINFGGSCPANFEFKGSIFGNPINIVLLDTAMFCDFLATYVKYPVYAASSLYALYILGGRKDV